MTTSANVTSVEEIESFRGALVSFIDAADDALLSADMVLRRFVEWLQHEQPQRLHKAHLAVQDELAEARAALQRKRISKIDDRPPDTTEEEAALKRAERKRDHIEECIANVRRWGRLIEQPLNEYRGQARQLGMLLEGQPPKSVAMLDRALAQLHAYLALEAPSSAVPESAASVARPADSAAQTQDALPGKAESDEETGEP